MQREDNIIEVKLLIKMHILDILISSILPTKATSDTNMDMVKPILETSETIKTDVQFNSVGFFDSPIKLLKYVNNIIPSGFPIKRPKYIPKNIVGYLDKSKLELILIPVLENANKGIIIKLLKILKNFLM